MTSKTSDDENSKDIHLTTFNEVKELKSCMTELLSTTNVRCSVTYDTENAFMSTSTPDVICEPSEYISTSSKRSLEYRISSIDLKPDNISTTLVWQNLIVKTREDKRKKFFQQLCSWKRVKPKHKVLLHNLSGAITGGLWAVMGKFLQDSHF